MQSFGYFPALIDFIDRFFRHGVVSNPGDVKQGKKCDLRKTKIFVLDELDYLYNKSQSVLYNIFDWPHYREVRRLVYGR